MTTMNRNLIVLICLLFTCFAHSQTTRQIKAAQAQQIGIRDQALVDQFLFVMPLTGSSRAALERQDLKSYMMPVRRLVSQSSDWCYALASSLEYYVNLNRNFKDNLSPDFIELSLRSKSAAPNLEAGLHFLVNQGTVSAAIVPYGASAIPTAVYATQSFKIANFLQLFPSVANSREKVFEVRKALTRGNPVIVSLDTDAHFPQLEGVFEWKPKGDTNQRRTLIVVGYDTTREAFELQSAFGNNWGLGGYIWVKYEDFGRHAHTAYAMVPMSY